MIFSTTPTNALYVSRKDVNNPLASYSKHGFVLDGAEWPSAEHYFQAMLFDDPQMREAIRRAPHPKRAGKLARQHRREMRKDWKSVRQVLMTRAVYTKCRRHPEVAAALRATGERQIIESSQFYYYWGCGRDGRGENVFGKVLTDVRTKLRSEEGGDRFPGN